MRMFFGPDEDILHIDPMEPNGYEWWYFDAISDDERYILVTIFFLGSPMSPYYKAVVDGKKPLPKDWCGVFFSLHERTNRGYVERAYTYNLYTDNPGDLNFFRVRDIRLGKSEMAGRYSHSGRSFSHHWDIKLDERNLWFGSTRAELRFDAAFVMRDTPARGEDQAHNWVCAAPQCGVAGTITLASGKTVEFRGTGYHDHNYGMLPWTDMNTWRWERVHFPGEQAVLGAVHYRSESNENTDAFFAVWNRRGEMRITDATMRVDKFARVQYPPSTTFFGSQQKYPLTHITLADIANVGMDTFHITEPGNWSLLQSAPFYRRFPTQVWASLVDGSELSGTGIGEQFTPAGLAGPIMSIAMWTRIRRRS